MDMMSDDVLLEELKRRFLDNKKALYDLAKMNEEIEKLQNRVAEQLGYKLVDHRLELYAVPLNDEKSQR